MNKSPLSIIQTTITNTINNNTVRDGVPDTLFYKPHPYEARIALDWSPDYTIAVFEPARRAQISPNVLAASVASILTDQEYIKRVEAIGPYVNFSLDDTTIHVLLERALSMGDQYGSSRIHEQSTVMITLGKLLFGSELTRSDTSSILRAESLSRVLRSTGFNVQIALQLGDGGYEVAEYIASKTAAPDNTTIQLDKQLDTAAALSSRDIRRIMDRLETPSSKEAQLFQSSKQEWLSYLVRSCYGLHVEPVHFTCDSDILSMAKNTLRNVAMQNPDRLTIDKDSDAIYMEGDSFVLLVAQDGRPTSIGFDVVTLLSYVQAETFDIVVCMRNSHEDYAAEVVGITRQFLKNQQGRIKYLKHHSSRAPVPSVPENANHRMYSKNTKRYAHVVKHYAGDELAGMHSLTKARISNLRVDATDTFLTDKERHLLVELLSYEDVIIRTADELNLNILQDYLQIISAAEKGYLVELENKDRVSRTEVLIAELLLLTLSNISKLLTIE